MFNVAVIRGMILGICLHCRINALLRSLYWTPVSSNSIGHMFPVGILFHSGEALGAIGSKDALNLLEEYTKDPSVEVRLVVSLS